MHRGLKERGILPVPIHYYPVGVRASVDPLDIVFTRRRESTTGKVIDYFTDGYWSHVAWGWEAYDFIGEALEWGLEPEHICKYTNHDVAVVELSSLPLPKTKAILLDYQDSMMLVPWEDRARYSYARLVSIGCAITWQGILGRLGFEESWDRGPYFGAKDRIICSGFPAEGLGLVGYTNDVPLRWVWPSMLADDLGVETDEQTLRKFGRIA